MYSTILFNLPVYSCFLLVTVLHLSGFALSDPCEAKSIYSYQINPEFYKSDHNCIHYSKLADTLESRSAIIYL